MCQFLCGESSEAFIGVMSGVFKQLFQSQGSQCYHSVTTIPWITMRNTNFSNVQTNVIVLVVLLPAATKLWPRLCFYTCV